jgi:hypothetical protein
MRRLSRFTLLCTLTAPLLFGIASGDSNIVKASATGKALITCTCVLGTSGCAVKRFDELAGQPRKTWTQDAHVIQGKEYDASLLCFRKRDVTGLGDGVCCEINKDERDLRFYFGSIGAIAR